MIDREAFAEIYKVQFIKTQQFLRKHGASPSASPDIAQAAWAKAWEKRAQLANIEGLPFWVNTIALNQFRASFRRRECQHSPRASYRQDFDSAIDANKCLSLCSSQDSDLLEMVSKGSAFAEIAKLHGRKPGTLRTRVFRAIRMIRSGIV